MRVNLFNSKNPNGKRVPVTVSIEHSDITSTNDGELIYMMVLETAVLSTSLTKINPVYINNITESKLQEELQKGLAIIGQQINWGILEEDTYSPTITNLNIPNNAENVSITTDLSIDVIDPFPASLIKKDTIKLVVNGIDITDKLNITEKGTLVNIHWSPIRIYK